MALGDVEQPPPAASGAAGGGDGNNNETPTSPPAARRVRGGGLPAALLSQLAAIADEEDEEGLERVLDDVQKDTGGAGGDVGEEALQPPQLFAMQNLPMLSRADSELSVLTSNADNDEAALVLAHLLELRRTALGQKHAEEAAGRIFDAGDTPTRWLQLLSRELEQLGVEPPAVEVRYRDLTITAKASVGKPEIATVASSIVNPILRLLRLLPPRVDLKLINGVSGVIKPRRFTLLLSPPGAGKSVLLRALAGRLGKVKTLKVTGDITYNGLHASECFVPRSVAYVSQSDEHTPAMSVYQTIAFARRCARNDGFRAADTLVEALERDVAKSEAPGGGGPRLKSEMFTETRRDEELLAEIHRAMGVAGAAKFGVFSNEVLLRAMGLQECRNTPVGSAMVRGVSGGQRKRVTTAELLAAHRYCVFFDEISTGLDSATLYSIIDHLGAVCRTFWGNYVVSLLQPPPEVFDLFDDVIVLSAGSVLYHGPTSEVKGFFEGLGFECPPRKELPGWLMELTTARGQLQYATPELLAAKGAQRPTSAGGAAPGAAAPAAGAAPAPLLAPREIARSFWEESPQGAAMRADLDAGYIQTVEADSRAMSRRRWTLGFFSMLWVATGRQMLLLKIDSALVRNRLIQTCIIAALAGSLFWQMPHTPLGARSYMGASFMAVLYQVMSNGPSLVSVLAGKPVWHKHRDQMFYSPMVHALAVSFAQSIPSILDSICYSTILYFCIGFYPSAQYFFTFLLVCLSMNLCMGAVYRLLAASVPDIVMAQSVGGMMQLILVLTSGFTIVKGSIPRWWIWGYYISPYAYAVRALVVNELTAPSWSAPSHQPGLTLGEAALQSFEFPTDRKWIWIGVGFLLGTNVILTLLMAVALGRSRPRSPQPFVAAGDEREFTAPPTAAAAEPRRKGAARRGRKKAGAEEKEAGTDGAAAEGTNGGANGAAAEDGSKSAAAAMAATEGPAAAGPKAAAAAGDVEMAAPQGDGGHSGVTLPKSPQITLVWEDLRYFVPTARANASALRRLRGAAARHAMRSGSGGPACCRRGAVNGAVDGENAAAAVPPVVPERLELLKGLSGYVRPYDLLALMGGSGAGKTTLMDVLAGRKTIGTVEGRIMVNGRPKEQSSWSRVLGYVEQSDIHSPETTVEEALWTSARLRLPATVKNSQVQAVVEEVLHEVDLTPLRSSLVGWGGGGTGLTVEQRKRLTIAVEMVANPGIIMMDEPTSGLDARAAAIVMRAVQAVAAGGRAVMVTIHQPSIDIFEGFTRLYLMQRGGRLAYFGPLGPHSRTLADYLEAVPGTPKLPPGANPSTWMLEVTGAAKALKPAAPADPTGTKRVSSGGGGGGGSGGGRAGGGASGKGKGPGAGLQAQQQQQQPIDWPAHYAASPLAAENKAAAAELLATPGPELEVAGGHYAAKFSTQFAVLLWKFTAVYWRAVSYNRTRCTMALVLGLAYGSMYWGVGVLPKVATIATVQNVMGVLFSANNFLGMTNLYSVMPVVGSERIIFYRERGASMYNPFAYGFAIALVEMPFLIMQALFFVPLVYGLGQFRFEPEPILFFFTMFLLCITYYTILGQWLVYLTPTQQLAQTLGANLNFAFGLVNGFMQPYPSIPVYWRWLNRLVPSTWVLYGIAGSQLATRTDVPIEFGGSTMSMSEFLEKSFGYKRSLVPYTLLILVAHILFVRVTSILGLRYLNFLRR